VRPEPDDVVVTGLGLVTPAGVGVEATWRDVTAGVTHVRPIGWPAAASFPARVGSWCSTRVLDEVRAVTDEHPSLAARYLRAAVDEAVAAAGGFRGLRTGVFVGTVMGSRPVRDVHGADELPDEVAATWTRPDAVLDLLADLPVGPRLLLAPGCSAGNAAIEAGRLALLGGDVDVAVCGGTEQLSLEVLSLFTSLRALTADAVRPFDARRRGMAPGEGAAVVVLERRRPAATEPRAVLRATSSAADAFHWTRPDPSGAALRRTLDDCLTQAGRTPDDVDWVCAHGTGTPASDGLEADVLAGALRGRRRTPVSSLKAMLGHAQGAAAAIEAAVGVLALERGFLPGTATLEKPIDTDLDLVRGAGRFADLRTVLSPAFGFGGAVTSILLERDAA